MTVNEADRLFAEFEGAALQHFEYLKKDYGFGDPEIGGEGIEGWVLFKNPGANGITIGGNPTIYGTVWSPLPAFTGGGSITVKYSQGCLSAADTINGNSNLPHQVTVTSWAEQ